MKQYSLLAALITHFLDEVVQQRHTWLLLIGQNGICLIVN